MTRSLANTTLAAILILGLLPHAAAQSCGEVQFESKYATTNLIKTGTEQLTAVGTNIPRFYRLYENEYFKHIANTLGSYTLNRTFSTEYPTRGYTIIPGSAYNCPLVQAIDVGPDGDLTLISANTNNAYCEPCESFQTSGDWSNPACNDVANAFISECLATLPGTGCFGSETTNSPPDPAYHFTRTECTNGWTSIEWTREQLSDEYTTAELIGNILEDLAAASYSEEWGTANNAGLVLANSEKCGDGYKLLYHFKFFSERDVIYKVTWDIVTYLPDGTSFVTPMEEMVRGTGDLVYTSDHEIFPSGRWSKYVVNGAVEVIPQSTGPGGPPGNGGPAGSGGFGGGGGCGGRCAMSAGGSSGAGGSGGGFAGGGAGGAGGFGDGGGSGDHGGHNHGFGDAPAHPAFEIGLGSGTNGASMGALHLSSGTQPSPALGTPGILSYTNTMPDVEVIPDNGALGQVMAPQALADVEIINSSKFELRFYYPSQVGSKDGNGFYQVGTNTPFVTWTVENPTAATNQWKITETRGGVNREFLYAYNTTNGHWTLNWPGNLRQDEYAVSYPTSVKREETITVRKPGGADALIAKRLYQRFAWGDGLIEEAIGTNGAAEVTTRYYDTSILTNNARRAPLDLVVFPNGSWERYNYDAEWRISEIQRGHGNAETNDSGSNSRFTTYLYSPVFGANDNGSKADEPRRVTETLNGYEISRRFKVIRDGHELDIVCPTPYSTWDAADNLVTTTFRYTNGVNTNRISKILHPDGTATFYSYAQTATNRTVTVSSGQPDGSVISVLSGTQTTTVYDIFGGLLSRTVKDISGGTVGAVIAQETGSNFDVFNRPQRITYLDGTYEDTQYACCGIESTTDRDGAVTQYFYDDLKRVISSTRLGVTTSNILDAAGQLTAVVRKGSNGVFFTQRQMQYDQAGRLVRETNALGGITVYSEGADEYGQTIHTNIYPDGGTRIETSFRDGTLVKVTGTAVHPMRFEYGSEAYESTYRAYTKEIKLDENGDDTPEWTKTYTDGAGRSYKTVFAGTSAPYRESSFNNLGQLVKERDPDNVTTLYLYNGRGQRAFTCIDSNRDDEIDFSELDRITETTNDVIAAHGTNVFRTRTYVWDTYDSPTPTLLSTVERSVEGLKTWRTIGSAVTTTIKTLPSGGAYTVTETAPDGTYAINAFQNTRLISTTRYGSNNVQVGATTFSYDPFGRRNVSTDARNGATTFTFNNADQIVSVTTPEPGTGFPAQTTTTFYDALGRGTNIVQPDGASVSHVFSPRGELLRTSGSRTYPVGYAYDAQGRLKHMTNWSSFNSGAGARVTTWHYDLHRGWMTNKVYPDGLGPKYGYTAAGRLASRLWARGTNTTYSYNNYGDLAGMTYDDGGTPNVSYVYTRRGQQETSTQGGNSWKLFYTSDGQLLSEAGTAGALSGLRVTNSFDSLLRRTSLATANGATLITSHAYTYETGGRLGAVADGRYSATNAYLANSPLISQITFTSDSTVRLTTTKAYDKLNRLTSISSIGGASSARPVSYSYLYNSANQRTRMGLADGSFWLYQYDSLGQVTSAKRYWHDHTPVAGQQFEYGFDDIGNRTSTKAGGDENGNSLRLANYTNNSLNHIVGRDVPGVVDVLGLARGTVSINSSGTGIHHRGEYFHKALAVNNSSDPQWQSIDVSATDGSSTNQSGNMFLPQTAEIFAYDADGNLTADGRWAYTWDAENRLLSMTAPSTAPTGSRKALHFGYDPKGRRISKVVSNWTGSAWTRVLHEKYVYDDWNLLSVCNGTNNAQIQSFVWGTDLSGTMRGAGGVGGLVAMNDTALGVHYPAYDGNGNVTSLIFAGSGSTSGVYEYSAFGETIRVSGPAAAANPFRFSTKFVDEESAHFYYGYRYYATSTGTWVSRDPISEPGSINQRRIGGPTWDGVVPNHESRFAFNAPLNVLDILGLGEWTFEIEQGDKFWFPGPVVAAAYSLDAQQCCSCETFALRRQARPHYVGAAITGSWRDDGSYPMEGFTQGSCRSKIPAEAFDEPGFRTPLAGWLMPLVIDFRWEVVCTQGADKGKVLSTSEQTVVLLHNGGAWVGHSPDQTTIHEKD